ncbi:CHAT domain [uncultured Clostridium sp.]|uniref:CHAT domain-containing protein n=1 Tax=uncultured Clostridium sp. TaxID=59620 RepID=UPI0008208D9B|nr:CHAT domain-containing protein [uncultured Clostridium sp.]SCJ97210.1 CHAT domain [uncultured Clostridium sp.]
MAFIDMYQRNVIRKKEEIAKLSSDKAKESKKIADLNSKINTAKQAISRSKIESIIKSRLRDIQNAEKSLADVNKKIADIDSKIVRKEKELITEEGKLRKELDNEEKKKIAAEKKRVMESERQLREIQNNIKRQGIVQKEMQRTLIDLQSIPENIKVLFMASNPTGTSQLKLGEEARDINEMIRKSEHRDSISFESRWAIRPLDILQAINELNPDIIHFSGHGCDTGELVLQNADGTCKLVKKEAIVQTIMTSSEKIRLVFFNACFSYGQAMAVVEHVEAAIGMNKSIGDKAASVFAAQFYSSIGFGLSLQKAFNQAKAALMLEDIPEEATPELYVKSGLDPNDIILVRP